MHNKLFIALGFVTLGAIFTAQAGPPLICHSFAIGNAQSLPWSADTTNWDNPDPHYDIKHLSDDTLKILNDSTPVLVRMETMRRATIYGEKDHGIAASLLASLRERATAKSTALANFDYGYFVESLKQMQWKYKDDLTAGVNGYDFVSKALSQRPNSAEMHFAAAIIAASYPQMHADRDEHLRKAKTARSDALLAQDLNWFGK